MHTISCIRRIDLPRRMSDKHCYMLKYFLRRLGKLTFQCHFKIFYNDTCTNVHSICSELFVKTRSNGSGPITYILRGQATPTMKTSQESIML